MIKVAVFLSAKGALRIVHYLLQNGSSMIDSAAWIASSCGVNFIIWLSTFDSWACCVWRPQRQLTALLQAGNSTSFSVGSIQSPMNPSLLKKSDWEEVNLPWIISCLWPSMGCFLSVSSSSSSSIFLRISVLYRVQNVKRWSCNWSSETNSSSHEHSVFEIILLRSLDP